MKPMLKALTVLALAACVSLTFTACKKEGTFPDIQAQSPLKGKNKNKPIGELQRNFHDIYELYKDSVVFISTEKTVKVRRNPFFDNQFFFPEGGNQPRTRKQTGLGTGFIISKDGYICTNHHVVANMDKIVVKIGLKQYSAEVIGSDKITDIALLKIEGDNFKPVYFGDSASVKVGNWAIAIGNPFGLDKTFTVGVISATVREDVDQMGNSHIQTDASINPGNSGGPLINLDGEVIGVNRMIYSRTGGSLGIGFAIPVNTTRTVLEQLQKFKKVKRGYLGVQIARMTPAIAQQLGLSKPEGALVGSVSPDSPAEKAGIRQGDVIIMVDKKPIREYTDLLKAVGEKPIGQSIKLQIWRNKKKKMLRVQVAERPEN